LTSRKPYGRLVPRDISCPSLWEIGTAEYPAVLQFWY
jgi:hypothetical protein